MISNTNLFSGPYLCNGATVQFPITFTFLLNTDLVVYLQDTTTLALTQLTLTTDYSATGAGVAAGGTLTTTATYATGKAILILRGMPLTQNVDILNQQAFLAAVTSGEFDNLVLLIQQLQEQINRAYKVPPGQVPTSLVPSGQPVAPTILKFLHPTLPQPSGIFPVADGYQLVLNGVGIMHWFQGGTDTNPTVLPVVGQ